jgi:hypothetical protein
MKKIVDLYNEGKSCKIISELLGINYHKISRILKDNNIKIRGHNIKEKKKVNDSFFKNINEISSYWLGFLFADGNISTYSDSFSLAISINDLSHLEKFKKDISSEYEIKTYKRKNQSNHSDLVKITISNKKLVDDLITLGCIRNKTFLLNAPKIDKKYYPDFIRGYFDGDGSITCNNRSYKTKKGIKLCKTKSCQVKFVGTFELLNFILQCLPITNKNLKLYNPKKSKDKNHYQLNIGGSKNIKLIKDYFYYSPNIVFLKRKFDKFI